MKKYIILILTLFLLVSCIKIDILNNNKKMNEENILYDKMKPYINNSEVTKDIFSKLYYLLKSEEGRIYFSNKDMGPIDIGSELGQSIMLKVLNNFNYLDLNLYDSAQKVLKGNFDFVKKSKSYYLFYNKKKKYFFSINNFHDMNGLCLLLSNQISSFTGLDNEIITNDIRSYEEYINEIITNSDMNNNDGIIKKIIIDNEEFRINTELLSILKKMKESGYKEHIDLYYEYFDKNININYSYNEFSLYFALSSIYGRISDSFCDNFNREYFLEK